MTEDGWELVERVRFEVSKAEGRLPSSNEARRAIAAVLDDLMEPSCAMMMAAANKNLIGISDAIAAAVDVKRQELGLASPEKPGGTND